MKRMYGWIKQERDDRDLTVPLFARESYSDTFSLRSKCPEIYDQADEGSCVWNGLAFADEFCQMKQPGGTIFMPSRNYGYYWTRLMGDYVADDAGCTIRDACKVYNKRGCCKETEWPYLKSNMFTRPPVSCDLSAATKKILLYQVVRQDENSIKSSLMDGLPVVFGSVIFSGFEGKQTLRTGIVEMPTKRDQELGGHCEAIIGWKTTKPYGLLWEVRNSWGSKVGDAGYFWFPKDYLLDPKLASDFWEIITVQE